MTSPSLIDTVTTMVSYIYNEMATNTDINTDTSTFNLSQRDDSLLLASTQSSSASSRLLEDDHTITDNVFISDYFSSSSTNKTDNIDNNNISSLVSLLNGSTLPPQPRPQAPPSRDIGLEVQIPIYIIIFLLSVVGNILVIVTVVQNKKMRSVTNVFLLNLAVSDLLLSVFCMPFTLVPLFLKNFIFGEVMCVAIRYMQGVSVAASCFTLVSISLERYFAICHPLKSRRWQTMSHSYKAIGVCWILALSLMMPVAVYHDLVQIGPSRHMCIENWPSHAGSKVYTMSLNCFMLVLPIVIMTLAYGKVSYTLWLGMRLEDKHNKEASANYSSSSNGVSIYLSGKTQQADDDNTNNTTNNKSISALTTNNSSNNNANANTTTTTTTTSITFVASTNNKNSTATTNSVSRPFRRIDAHRAMRQSNTEKSRAAKKRVIKMLFIIVLEFFVFWTPVYVITTWMTFDYEHAREYITPKMKSLTHLVSYISACCNPITYCFMNKNFRNSFLLAFRCRKRRHIYTNKSQISFTGASVTSRAVHSRATSYDKINDYDDISENGL